jgi:DNA methylase
VTTQLDTASRLRLAEGILSTERVAGLTHNFYRYPARFSPEFVRAMISEFTAIGDLIYDPFMGGGTTLVEAMVMGRNSIGTDISSLATFISKVKTTVYTKSQVEAVSKWVAKLAPLLNVGTDVPAPAKWIRTDYQRNINDRETWRIRKLLEVGLSQIKGLRSISEQALARCILLKTGQWALDCREVIPSIAEFNQQLSLNATAVLSAATEFAEQVKTLSARPQVKCHHRSAIGTELDAELFQGDIPSLILTSPPYPGLHVLYHRWQVKGRRETAAPFWIAGTLDGDGSSFYTFGDRKQKSLDNYFANVRAAFESMAHIADHRTLIIQMVAFSKPEWQLPRYLDTMNEAGFVEQDIAISSEDPQGRVWRSVPGRKWYASQLGATAGSQEVVLFHRKKQTQ